MSTAKEVDVEVVFPLFRKVDRKSAEVMAVGGGRACSITGFYA